MLTDFADAGLVRLIAQMGDAALARLPKGIRDNPDAVAETIANNVRRVIIDEHAINPKYYDKMSALLDDLIRQRQLEAISYKEYLEKLLELAHRSASENPTPFILHGPTTAPGARSSTSGCRGAGRRR